jgi:hypothetical protein
MPIQTAGKGKDCSSSRQERVRFDFGRFNGILDNACGGLISIGLIKE